MIPIFSVIIPIYKVEEYLEQCINSVLSQTFKDYELILVDDGSPDNCPKLCDEFAKENSNIKVIHKENGGLSSARNVGVAEAVAEYIIFLDADDFWLDDNFLQNIYNRLKLYKSDVICLNYNKVFDDQTVIPYYFNVENMSNEYFGDRSIEYIINTDTWVSSAWNKIIKRKLFSDYNLDFIVGINSEDIDWSARLIQASNSFDFLNKPYIGYRQRNTSISKTMSYKKVERVYQNILIIRSILEKVTGDKELLIKQYYAYQIGTLIFNISLLNNRNDRKQLSEKLYDEKNNLKYSRNKKIKLLNILISLLGIDKTISLLNLFNRIKGRV